MTTKLTEQERQTLVDAQAIITAHTPEGQASWSLAFHSKGMFGTSCYFDSIGKQHMLWTQYDLVDVVEAGIKCERAVVNNPEKAKAQRIARLKAELLELGEADA